MDLLFQLYFSAAPIQTNTSVEVSNNTIYIIDQSTSCAKTKGCIIRGTNPFENITDFIHAIRLADKKKPIKVVVSTYGGMAHACQSIVRSLRLHPSGFIVYCNEGFSAGGVITISSNEIVMNKYSRVGKIDPIRQGNEMRILKTFDDANTTSAFAPGAIDLMAKEATSVLNSYEKFLSENVANWSIVGESIKKNLIYSELSHATSFGKKEMEEMGFDVREPTEEEEELYFGYYQS